MKQWIVAMLCLLAWFVGNGALAQAEYETVQSTGQAARADKALSKALANAVSQVNGVQAVQKMDIQETTDRVYLSWYGSKVELASQEVNRGYTQTFSAGVIRSYKVLKTDYDDKSGHYRVHIEAMVFKLSEYANIGDDRSSLIPLSVVPFVTRKIDYESLVGKESGAALSERLSSLLSDELMRSNRFRVLDRVNHPVSITEQLITQSLGAKTGQQIKLDQSLSADFIVVAEIHEFSVGQERGNSYGAALPHYYGDIVLDIRVIEMATQEIRFSQRFERYLEHDQIKIRLDALDHHPLIDAQSRNMLRTQRAIETMWMAEASDDIIKAFHPNYVRRGVESVVRQPMDDRTPVSGSPGSSERPILWR